MASTIDFPPPKNVQQVYCNLLGQYFVHWAKQTSMHIAKEGLEEKFAYIDLAAAELVANPTKSPSYVILEWASQQPRIRSQLYTLLNERNAEKAAAWATCLDSLPALEHFTFAPQLYHSTIDNIVQQNIATVRSLPTLISADLCANEGLTWEWLRDLVQLHPADCFLWVNYQQLLNKSKRNQERLQRILGDNYLQTASKKRQSAAEKESYWKSVLEKHLQEVLGNPNLGLLCYSFFDEQDKIKYFLYFLTKDPKAYTTMRQIMNMESQVIEDGIGNLCYHPNQGARKFITSPTLFGPMFELEQHLLSTYLHQTIQFVDLYEEQHWGHSFTKKNYIDALLNLEEKGQIKITRKQVTRGRALPKRHLPNKTFISFRPPKT